MVWPRIAKDTAYHPLHALTIFIYSPCLQPALFLVKSRIFTLYKSTLYAMTSDAFLTQTIDNTDRRHNTSGKLSAYSPRQTGNRSYGFKELAVLYFPNIAPASASIRLKAWIKDCPELLHALDETHYNLTARVLTPRQKALIEVAFGSPF